MKYSRILRLSRATAYRKLQAKMYGFPYSRHRSKRIIKKLIQRHRQVDFIVFDEASTLTEDMWTYAMNCKPLLRNDMADATAYAFHKMGDRK